MGLFFPVAKFCQRIFLSQLYQRPELKMGVGFCLEVETGFVIVLQIINWFRDDAVLIAWYDRSGHEGA